VDTGAKCKSAPCATAANENAAIQGKRPTACWLSDRFVRRPDLTHKSAEILNKIKLLQHERQKRTADEFVTILIKFASNTDKTKIKFCFHFILMRS
jgi:hypothetical protein